MPDARDSGAGTIDGLTRSTGRRDFLRIAALGGAGVAVPALLAACSDAYNPIIGPNPSAGVTLDFSSDVGVLNFAYALEQLEAAFYIKVIASPYSGMSSDETGLLTAIRDHEIIHRDFFAAAIGAAKIPNLSVDFSKVDFTSRTSVLTTAQVFEDLGVAAYNGAGQILSSTTYLGLAGKIVSVEARHAAAIRDVIAGSMGTAFAGDDVVDANGLDRAFSPAKVLDSAHAGAYITTTINPINIPSNLTVSS